MKRGWPNEFVRLEDLVGNPIDVVRVLIRVRHDLGMLGSQDDLAVVRRDESDLDSDEHPQLGKRPREGVVAGHMKALAEPHAVSSSRRKEAPTSRPDTPDCHLELLAGFRLIDEIG